MPQAYVNAFRGPDLAQIDRSRSTNALLANQVDQIPMTNALAKQNLDINAAENTRAQGTYDTAQQNQKLQWFVGATEQALQNPSAWPTLIAEGKQHGLIPADFNQPYDEAKLKQFVAQAKTQAGMAPVTQLETIQGPDGSVLQRDPRTNELSNVLAREPRQPAQPGSQPPNGYRFNADGSLSPIPGGPADPAVAANNRPLRPIPASAATGIIANRTSLSQIDRAIAAVQANPKAFGLTNYLGDTIKQRTDPGGVNPRAQVADIGSLKIHDRSGAAVTASEQPRLKPFIPTATDEPGVIVTKLQNLRANLEAQNDETESFYSADSGYRQMGPQQGGASAQEITATGPNGQKLALRNGQWVPMNAGP